MTHQTWLKSYWALLAFLLPILTSYSQNLPPFTVINTICPNPCKGESLYKIIFTAPAGTTITASSGVVRNDTITDIDPKNTYTVIITIKGITNVASEQTIALPICDFLLPTPAIVANKSICDGESIPEFKVLTTNTNITTDWFDSLNGGLKLATGNSFKPIKAGTYYAQTRDLSTDCTSLSRTPVRLTINIPICVPSTFRIIKKV
jgi:hypothetical protein